MSQPHDYGTEDVRKMVTLAVRDMVWFDQTTGDPKAFLPLAEKIVEHVTKNLCGAPEGWDVDAVDRQYEKLRELVGDHADADIRCAVANLRNANRILRLGGYYTSTGQPDIADGHYWETVGGVRTLRSVAPLVDALRGLVDAIDGNLRAVSYAAEIVAAERSNHAIKQARELLSQAPAFETGGQQ